MEAFTTDTSGYVTIVTSAPDGGSIVKQYRWSDLSPFVQGYIEAALSDEALRKAWWLRTPGRFDIPAAVPFRCLAPATLARILTDCGPDSRGYVHPTGATMGIANTFEGGGLFWRTRQEGMWAGFSPLRTTLSNDGLIRFEEGE